MLYLYIRGPKTSLLRARMNSVTALVFRPRNPEPFRPGGLNYPDKKISQIWGCSSAGRALAWHARGQGFDPPQLHQLPAEVSEWQTIRSQKPVAVRPWGFKSLPRHSSSSIEKNINCYGFEEVFPYYFFVESSFSKLILWRSYSLLGRVWFGGRSFQRPTCTPWR